MTSLITDVLGVEIEDECCIWKDVIGVLGNATVAVILSSFGGDSPARKEVVDELTDADVVASLWLSDEETAANGEEEPAKMNRCILEICGKGSDINISGKVGNTTNNVRPLIESKKFHHFDPIQIFSRSLLFPLAYTEFINVSCFKKHI